MRKLKLILAITFIALLIGIIIFLNLPAKDKAALIPHFDVPEEFVAVREYTEDERKEIGIYRYIIPDAEGSDAYAVGINQYDKPVFKDPHQAIAALYVDYADALDYMGNTTGSLFNGINNNQTITWNTETDDPVLRNKINFVVQFILIFSNSFHK